MKQWLVALNIKVSVDISLCNNFKTGTNVIHLILFVNLARVAMTGKGPASCCLPRAPIDHNPGLPTVTTMFCKA